MLKFKIQNTIKIEILNLRFEFSSLIKSDSIFDISLKSSLTHQKSHPVKNLNPSKISIRQKSHPSKISIRQKSHSQKQEFKILNEFQRLFRLIFHNILHLNRISQIKLIEGSSGILPFYYIICLLSSTLFIIILIIHLLLIIKTKIFYGMRYLTGWNFFTRHKSHPSKISIFIIEIFDGLRFLTSKIFVGVRFMTGKNFQPVFGICLQLLATTIAVVNIFQKRREVHLFFT